jgi:hypothetical protein
MTSRTHLTLGLIALLAVAVMPVPAAAGEFAAELQAGYLGLTATNSAEAVLGSSGGFTWGAAGRYTFYKGLYGSAGFRTFSASGERVFVAGPTDPVAGLGFPLSVRITPVNLTVGYRFRDGKLVVPYAGLGGVIASYSEESSVAGTSYDQSTTKGGFQFLGGVEVGRGRFRFGAEGGWSTIPNAIGVGGVSNVYNEDDIGGWSVVGKVVYAFGAKKPPAENDDPVDAGDEPSEEAGPPEPER